MDLLRNPSGDLDVTNGNVQWVRGAKAVGQHAKIRLEVWFGESVYDREAGVPYLEGVFGKQPYEGIVFILTERLATTLGVESVRNVFESFDYDNDLRTLRIQPQVVVSDEPVNFTVEIQG